MESIIVKMKPISLSATIGTSIVKNSTQSDHRIVDAIITSNVSTVIPPVTVSVDGTELEFLQAFITALTSADSRITCLTTDLAEQFETSTNYPTFSFDFGGADTITFKRSQQASMSNVAYTVSSTNWATDITDYALNYDYILSTYTTSRIRKLSFRIISSDDLLVVDFIDNRSATRGQICCLTGATKAIAYSNTSPYTAISNTFRLTDASTMTKVDRMSYQYNMTNANQLEIISNKVIAYSGGGIRMMTLDNLTDVSTIRAGRIITIANQTYYSLDTHTLVAI